MHAISRMLSFVVASAFTLVACIGAPPPPPGAGESSSGTPDSTGFAPTTMAPVEDTSGTGTGSSGDTGTNTSSSSGGTTMGVEPTSSSSEGEGSSSSGTGSPSECTVPADCPNNETCNPMGGCESVCSTWGPDDYTYCLTSLGTFDSVAICGEAMSCIITNAGGDIQTAVCGRSCATACDCPVPAATGDAIVSCGDILGNGTNRCHLSCANGETCPDGMTCLIDGMGFPSYCTHPIQPIAPYGNCDNMGAGCVAGSTCATSGTNSVCTPLCPGGSEAECPAPPPGGELDCGTAISPPDGNDCHLDCVMSSDCPEGMSCVMGTSTLCMWP